MIGLEGFSKSLKDLGSQFNDAISQIEKLRNDAKSQATKEQLQEMDSEIENIKEQKKKLDAINNS